MNKKVTFITAYGKIRKPMPKPTIEFLSKKDKLLKKDKKLGRKDFKNYDS